MNTKIEKDKLAYSKNKSKNGNNKENEDPDLNILQNAASDLEDVALGNQMDDDILTINEDALENPNPTKQDGEENERPGGGLRK